jgi:BASS family bile acid:Na+ symporter
MSQISNNSFRPLKSTLRPALFVFIFNYVLFTAISLTLSYFLIKDPELWTGYVIIAAAPAGVSIAPFTGILGGEVKFSLTGVIASHLIAVIIIPLYGYIFIGQNFIQPLRIIILFSEVIIAPFIISRIIIRFNADRFVIKHRGPFINWGLFIVIFTVIALNRDFFFSDIQTVGIVMLISAISVLGTGLILEALLRRRKRDKKLHSSLILFATVKNGGFAAATALSLASERASVPSAITSVFIIIYLIYLSFRSRYFNP